MKIWAPVTRRAAVALTTAIATVPSQHKTQPKHLPWLSPALPHDEPNVIEAQSLLRRMSYHEGTSLDELYRTGFRRILNNIGDSQVVLIGEATHGTEEFYQIRADLTRSLLEGGGFDAVLCEGDFPPFFDLNRFVGGAPLRRRLQSGGLSKQVSDRNNFQSRNKDDRSSKDPLAELVELPTVDDAMEGLRDRFPVWMWRNSVMRDFLLWLRLCNEKRRGNTSDTLPIQLLGMDIYSLFRSADEVIEYLSEAGEGDLANLARQRYSVLNSFRPEPHKYAEAIQSHMAPAQVGAVVAMLTSLLKEEARLCEIPGDGHELFNCIENARVVAAAESYYRQSFLDPELSWNLRDSAFLGAIQNVITFVEKRKRKMGDTSRARVVVWAHNSHVGDAAATEHAARGQHNVGQLCRQVFGRGNVYIVGFSSNEGMVRASREWGGQDQIMRLNPAFEGSHEHLLHQAAQKRRQNAFGFTLQSNARHQLAGDIDEAARIMLDVNRVERFVGVSYNRANELRSHYTICNMSNQFDFIFHVDHSTALRTDKVKLTMAKKFKIGH